jgi:signal transduction histidine kinase
MSGAVTAAHLLPTVIHEMNNALVVVSGTVELLEGRRDLPEYMARYLERLRTECRRVDALIAQVRAFTQAPREGRTEVGVRDLVRGAVDLRRLAVARAGLTIVLTDDSDPCMTHGNPGLLQLAVLALLMNSEQVLAGTPGRITVEPVSLGDSVDVRVASDHPGSSIAPDLMPEAFPATRHPFDLWGLNLLAARTIAESHDGSLTGDATTGRIVFTLRLPALHPIRS